MVLFVGAIVNWALTIIGNCIGFARLSFVIGPENWRHSPNQSDAKPTPTSTWSHAFSRASDGLLVFTLSSHWPFKMSSFLLIVITLVLF